MSACVIQIGCFLLSSSACVAHAALLSLGCLSAYFFSVFDILCILFQALLQPGNDCFSCEKRVLAPTPWQLQGSGRKRGRAVMAADIHSLSVIFTKKCRVASIFRRRGEKIAIAPSSRSVPQAELVELSVTVSLMKLIQA